MAEFPNLSQLSLEQLRQLVDNPAFSDAPLGYRQQARTRLQELQTRQRAEDRPLRAQRFLEEVRERQVREEIQREQTSRRLGEQREQTARQLREAAQRTQPSPTMAPTATAEDLTSAAMRSVLPRPSPEAAAPQPTPQAEAPQVGAPTPAAPAADPLGAVSAFLTGSGRSSPFSFTRPTKPAEVDEVEARRRLSEGMPGERAASETYKADPYMTMLQTGLRILAAKPELGQTALSQIAGPVAGGVEQYRAEREKERASAREEAKEAREESYRRYGAQRDISSKLLDIGEAAKNRDLQFQQLQLQIEKGASDQAIQRAELGFKRAELELKRVAEAAQLRPRDALKEHNRLEEERLKIERIPEEQRTAEQSARLDSIARTQAAVMRATGAYIGAEGRRESGAVRAEAARRAQIARELADLQKIPEWQRDNTWKSRVATLLAEQQELVGTTSAPSALPPPPGKK